MEVSCPRTRRRKIESPLCGNWDRWLIAPHQKLVPSRLRDTPTPCETRDNFFSKLSNIRQQSLPESAYRQSCLRRRASLHRGYFTRNSGRRREHEGRKPLVNLDSAGCDSIGFYNQHLYRRLESVRVPVNFVGSTKHESVYEGYYGATFGDCFCPLYIDRTDIGRVQSG